MIVLRCALNVVAVGMLIAGAVLDRDGLLIGAVVLQAFTAGLLIGEAL